ncbi:SCO1860 family LAETG-anchored protein [Streptomyces sp. NPDC001380]|uniref:SCO1860 family LAETG-anchored protein n=1 Tax=Streptomyces sp. NPDC001380 TaxID=3364566 RepID=UPI0036A11352
MFSVLPRLRPAAVAALTAGLAVAGLPADAHAAGAAAEGRATAAVADVALDVSLLHRTVHVPVDASLGEVRAPGESGGTVLTARVDGVAQGAPLTLLKADIAHSRAVVDADGSRASVQLVGADVHLPGLPLIALLHVDTLEARVSCPAHGEPTARVNLLGTVRVLGRTVELSAGGPTRVAVPGVGEVSAELSRRAVTSAGAAATALELDVAVDPAALGVARVAGRVTLGVAACGAPAAPGGTAGGSDGTPPAPAVPEPADSAQPAPAPAPAGSTPPAAAPPAAVPAGAVSAAPQAGPADLAETGSSGSPLLLGGAALSTAAGAAALVAARRRSARTRRG